MWRLHSFFFRQEPQRSKKRGREPKADDNDDGFEVVPIENPGKSSEPSGVGDSFRVGSRVLTFLLPLAKYRILDPEGLALGAVIASSKKAKRDLIDNSFSR